MLGGGLAGALTVATQGLAVAVIGVSLFTVGVVAGQTLNGLVLDRVGYGPAGVVAVTMPRIAGGALALIAVGISLQGGVLERVPCGCWCCPFWPVSASRGSRRPTGGCASASGRR
jgi:transporter family-2 protein